VLNLTRGSCLRPGGTPQWFKQAISHPHNVFQQARRDHFKALCDEEEVKGADVDVKEMSRDKRNVQCPRPVDLHGKVLGGDRRSSSIGSC